MANALGLAATTRILRRIIKARADQYGLDDYVGQTVLVTAEPPLEDNSRHRINLFLYRANESPGDRNSHLPSRDNQGRPLQAPVLSLDLNYAVTVYGDSDYQSEYMLGCAMQALHEVPVLNRALIREVLSLDTDSDSPLDSRLFEQMQSIRIRHRNLSEADMSRLWSAFQVPYRLTAFYEVSLVYIESEAPSRMPMPVLARPEPRVRPSLEPQLPTLVEANPPSGPPGETIILNGISLKGTNMEVEGLPQDRSVDTPPINIPQGDVSGNSVSFQVPATWPVGFYELRLSQDNPAGAGRRVSNRIAFQILPSISVSGISRDPNPPNAVTLQLDIQPALQPSQQVKLLLGTRVFPGPAIAAETSSLSFSNLELEPGSYPIRLQVDGISSAWLDRDAAPATVLPSATVTIP
jgi:hypothetical protein